MSSNGRRRLWSCKKINLKNKYGYKKRSCSNIFISGSYNILFFIFQPEPQTIKQNIEKKEFTQKTSEEPSIEQTEKVSKISRNDSIKDSERIDLKMKT